MARKSNKTQLKELTRSGYLLSDPDVASMARQYAASTSRADNVRDTYLRVLVAHSLRELKGNGAIEPGAAIETAHERLYAVVLKAITTPDIQPEEGLEKVERRRRTKARNSRSNFARTAKLTLVKAVQAGAKLATMKPGEVTKAGLQAYYTPARAGPQTFDQKWEREKARVERLLLQVKEDDPGAARDLAEDLQAKVSEVLKIKPVAVRRRRVGELTLHPH